MKKMPVWLFLAIVLASGSASAGNAADELRTIKIVPDPGFGLGVAWDSIFNQGRDKSLVFLQDGSFYRGSNQEGKIYKFDAAGKIVKSFGRKGQGPGDLSGIASLDILDGKILVAFDGGRSLSLFDLEGNFIKKIALSGTIWAMNALRNGHVALVKEISAAADPKWFKGRFSVFSLDLETGAEKEFASFDYAVPQGEFFIRITQFDRYVRLAKAGPDTLVLAFPSTPEIFLYTLNGEKKGAFKLDIESVKFSWDILSFVMDLDHDEKGRQIMTLNKGKVALPEFLPYFLTVAGDSEGRIVLLENNYARKTYDVTLRIQAQDGKLLSRVRIEPGAFEAVPPFHFRNGYAYSWLAAKDGDGTFVFGRWKLGY